MARSRMEHKLTLKLPSGNIDLYKSAKDFMTFETLCQEIDLEYAYIKVLFIQNEGLNGFINDNNDEEDDEEGKEGAIDRRETIRNILLGLITIDLVDPPTPPTPSSSSTVWTQLALSFFVSEHFKLFWYLQLFKYHMRVTTITVI